MRPTRAVDLICLHLRACVLDICTFCINLTRPHVYTNRKVASVHTYLFTYLLTYLLITYLLNTNLLTYLTNTSVLNVYLLN